MSVGCAECRNRLGTDTGLVRVVFEKAMTSTVIIRPYLARALLGWQPRKAGLLDHLDIYYNAWKASEGVQ